MLKDEYNAMFVEDHEAEKNQPCPPDLAREEILECDGVNCRVFYNYVPPYTYGVMPMNCWWGYAEAEGYNWRSPLNEEVKTLEEACDVIRPIFEIMVKRWRAKMKGKK